VGGTESFHFVVRHNRIVKGRYELDAKEAWELPNGFSSVGGSYRSVRIVTGPLRALSERDQVVEIRPAGIFPHHPTLDERLRQGISIAAGGCVHASGRFVAPRTKGGKQLSSGGSLTIHDRFTATRTSGPDIPCVPAPPR
jgi:hypothetical protein